MSVPSFTSLMLPTLEVLASRGPLRVTEIREQVAVAEGLSSEDVQQMLPSGRSSIFTNRVAWALSHMGRAGLVERIGRGEYCSTQEGERLLSSEPSHIDLKLLGKYPEYRDWRQREKGSPTVARIDATSSLGESSADTPKEVLELAIVQLRTALEAEVLQRIRKEAPKFLEHVAVRLMLAMGYGGGDAERGRVTGGAGDGGIDGIIGEDVLGLDKIFLQAKHYGEGKTVGSADLQRFVGAIAAKGSDKGVFITTSLFTSSAEAFIAQSQKKIVLIDGPKLAQLMVQHGVGVRTQRSHEIKEIDDGFFDQES